jgi:hypothetical protein
MDRSYFVKKYSDSTKEFSETDIINMLELLILFFCFQVGRKLLLRMRNIDVNLIDRRPESNYLGDNCIVFENFTASIGDLMVANSNFKVKIA